MKIDKRRSEVPNLNHSFRNYVSGKYLLGYYIFSKQLTQEKTLTNSALGDEMADAIFESSGSTYYPYISEKSSPYQGRADLYSGEFRTFRKSDFRIRYSNSTDPFVNTPPWTIDCWVYIPDINVLNPDSDVYIYQKIQPAGAAAPAMEFSLRFVTTPGDNKFIFTWYPSAAPASTKNIQTNSCQDWKNPVYSGGQWVHVAVVVKTPKSGGSSYNSTDLLSDFVEIYCNGYNEQDSAASTFGNTWTPKTATNGDVVIGKAPYDNTGLTDNQYWNTFNIHSMAIWNTSLAADEVYSLYSAAKQYEGSGVINLPPRVYLSELDNRGGRYPTIQTTGDINRLGHKTPHFDDTKTRLFWNYTPTNPDLNNFNYLLSWQAEEGSYKFEQPPSGSLKFLSYFTASLESSNWSGSFAEHSLNHPPLTGVFGPLTASRYTAYREDPGPIFNTTGSNWFTYDSSDVHNSDYIVVPTRNMTSSMQISVGSPAYTDPYGVIPVGLARYKDALSFVEKGGVEISGADSEDVDHAFIDGIDGYPANTAYIECPVGADATTWSGYGPGYSQYLNNTPHSISTWVYPAQETGTSFVATGRKTILSKGLLVYQTGASGSYDYGGSVGQPVLEQSSFEYRLQLSGATSQAQAYVVFEVGSSWNNVRNLSAYNSENNIEGGGSPDFTGYKLNGLMRKRTVSTCIQPDVWNHIVVTWNGKNWNDVDIFVNGQKNPGGPPIDESFSSSFFKVTIPTTQSLFIGATEFRNAKTGKDYAGQFFSGSINHVAMWKSKLTDDQAYALYKGVSGSLQPYGQYNFKVSYPSRIEVNKGDETPLGSSNPEIAQISGSLATPNRMPDIVAVGSVARDIGYDFAAWSGSSDFSDNYVPFVENLSYLDDSPFYTVGTTQIPGFNAPLKDKIQINIDITPRPDLYSSPPNFGGEQGQYIYRNWSTYASSPSGDKNEECANVTRTGMYYWDPQNKLWDHVGLKNPSYRQPVSNPAATPMYGRRNQERYGLATTSSYFSCSHASQFMPANYYQATNCMLESTLDSNVVYQSLSDDEKLSMRQRYLNQINDSFSHIGLPHNHNFAPFGSRYFATSSNLLKMSQYINDPLLLEKIEIDLGSVMANQNFDYGDDYLCSQPFSMYTFFLYRQTQNIATPIEIEANAYQLAGLNAQDKITLDEINSGSQRELISWSTAVFYNPFASSSLALEAMTGSGLFDANAVGIWNVPISPTSSLRADFYHSWGLDPSLFSTTKRVQYTGSLKLQFTPKVCGPRAQKTAMFTAYYPWSPPGPYNLYATVQRATAFGPGDTAGKPGYNKIWNATKTSLWSSWDNPGMREGAVAGTIMPAYSPWIGSNTDQSQTSHQLWDPGSWAGNSPARHNVYSWPGGSMCLPYSASGVEQRGWGLTYLLTHVSETAETFNNLVGQPPWNDSGFTGNWPIQINNLGPNLVSYPVLAGNVWGITSVAAGWTPNVTAPALPYSIQPSEQLMIVNPQYTETANTNTNHLPGFANASLPTSGGIAWDDFSNNVEVKNTTFLLNPEDTLVLGVEKINIPPSLIYWALGGYYSGSYPHVASASWNNSAVSNKSIPDNSSGPNERFYGVFADHHREHYHAGIHTASFLRITSENKSFLRLYGSLVKRGAQYFPPSTQQLTTDAVHEALHYDNPVLDQWEINSEKEYTGSMRTLYITGTMTRPLRGTLRYAPSSSLNPKIKGEVGGTVEAVFADKGIIGYTTRTIAGENSSEYGDMFSFKRNVTLVDNRVVYYDSMPPKIALLWSKDGFQPATWYSSVYHGGTNGPMGLGGLLVPEGSTGGAGDGGEWVWSRKYWYGWLTGFGTGSISEMYDYADDGTVSKARYFLNGWNMKSPQIAGVVPGGTGAGASNSPSDDTTIAAHYMALNTGSTGVAIQSVADPPVSGEVGNHIWPSAFPFEPRYAGIPRLRDQDYSAVNTRRLVSTLERPPGSGSGDAVTANAGAPRISFGGVGFTVNGYMESCSPPSFRQIDPTLPVGRIDRRHKSCVVTIERSTLPVTDDYISYLHKTRPRSQRSCAFALFGRGYGNRFLDVVDSKVALTAPGMPDKGIIVTQQSARNNISGSYGVCAKPAGFKYGLINAVSQNPIAVFRGTHYGQFRDMLEQRPYTRYFDKRKNKMSRNSWVVRSRFVEPTWVNPSGKLEKKSPSETQSSNLSVFSTSSLPFFDETDLYPTGRNRGPLPGEGNVNVILNPLAVKTSASPFSF